jgi:hypothetical protein
MEADENVAICVQMSSHLNLPCENQNVPFSYPNLNQTPPVLATMKSKIKGKEMANLRNRVEVIYTQSLQRRILIPIQGILNHAPIGQKAALIVLGHHQWRIEPLHKGHGIMHIDIIVWARNIKLGIINDMATQTDNGERLRHIAAIAGYVAGANGRGGRVGLLRAHLGQDWGIVGNRGLGFTLVGEDD